MKKKPLDEIINRKIIRIKQAWKIIKFAKKANKIMVKNNLNVYTIIFDDEIVFKPKTEIEMHIARKIIEKTTKKKWIDKIYSIDAPLGDRYLIRYRFDGEDEILEKFNIWYEGYDFENLPIPKKEGCGFKKITEEKMAYVCEKKV